MEFVSADGEPEYVQIRAELVQLNQCLAGVDEHGHLRVLVVVEKQRKATDPLVYRVAVVNQFVTLRATRGTHLLWMPPTLDGID